MAMREIVNNWLSVVNLRFASTTPWVRHELLLYECR